MQGLIGTLFMQAFGSYAAIFEVQFGWSKTALAGAFSMARVESGLLGPLQGWLIDRFGPRVVMRIGLTLLGLGFILFSQINSLPMFYAAFLVMAVGQSLGGFMALTVAAVNWFQRRRAMALGIMQTGFAAGGLAVPLVAWMLVNVGWRETAFASGIAVWVIGLPLSQVIRHRPEDYGYEVDGGAGPGVGTGGRDAAPAPAVSFTPRQAMRSPAFWMISLGHASALLIVGGLLVHLVLHLTDSLGYSIVQANFVWALVAAMQIVGQVGGGYLGDRTDKRVIAATCMVGHAVAILLLAYASALWMVIAFAILHGLSWGTRGPLMAAIRADYFGPGSFGTIMGFSSLIVMMGMMSGPIIAGVMADRTGGYEAGFTLLAALAAGGAAFFLLARKPGLPEPVAVPGNAAEGSGAVETSEAAVLPGTPPEGGGAS